MKNVISVAVAAVMLTSGLPVFAQPTLEDQKHESGVLLDGMGNAKSAGLMNYVNSSASEETLKAVGAAKDVETAASPAVERAKADLAVSSAGLKPSKVEDVDQPAQKNFFNSKFYKFYAETLFPPKGGSRLLSLARAVLAPVVVPLANIATGAIWGAHSGVVPAIGLGVLCGLWGIVHAPVAVARNLWSAITGK